MTRDERIVKDAAWKQSKNKRQIFYERRLNTMPDFISRKKLKKKVLDRWENEGGKFSAAGNKSKESHPPPKRKRKKDRQRVLTEAG